MATFGISRDQLKDILLRNWLTHDALWYGEVAAKFGMAEASPMNLRVCRKLGRIEFKRLMNAVQAAPPKNFKEYRELFEQGAEVFVPEFITMQIDYPGGSLQGFHVSECFAHQGMKKLGVLPEYECGIFERIEGWFDAMGLRYTRTPDLSRCLKFKGEECRITVQFHFE
jgi:Family of unknown function (DUF6125)